MGSRGREARKQLSGDAAHWLEGARKEIATTLPRPPRAPSPTCRDTVCRHWRGGGGARQPPQRRRENARVARPAQSRVTGHEPTPDNPLPSLSSTHTDATPPTVGVTITRDAGATLFSETADGTRTTLASSHAGGYGPVCPGGAAFWLSYDAVGGLRYGRGYIVEAAVLASCRAPRCAVEAGGPLCREPAPRRVRVRVGGFSAPPVAATPHAARLAARKGGDRPPAVWCGRLPLAHTPSPLALPPGAPASLAGLGDPAAPVRFEELPRACAQLVAAVCAPGVGLEWPGTPRGALAAAISHSLRGGALAARLAAKAAASGLKIPYLRVAVAAPRRCAPGEPFVLELWPAGCASPVHSHGGACGVFRVLHGTCTLRTFNAAHADGPPDDRGRVPHCEARALPLGSVGWFDGGRHQTHQIVSAGGPPGTFAATLQAFRYDDDDNVACPFMEVEVAADRPLDAAGGDAAATAAPAPSSSSPRDFEPVSDYTFAELAELVLAEHAAAVAAVDASAAPTAPAPSTKRVRGESPGDMERFDWAI